MDYDPNLPWRDVRGEGFNAHVGPIRFASMGKTPSGAPCYCASLVLDDRHVNVGGVCHGGVLMSLADVAMGAATFDAGGGHPCATIQIDAHFLAAARARQRLVAVATQLRKVRELSFMRCEIWTEGRQVLRASGTWKHLASRAPGASAEGAVL